MSLSGIKNLCLNRAVRQCWHARPVGYRWTLPLLAALMLLSLGNTHAAEDDSVAATTDIEAERAEYAIAADPWEGFNRKMFAFNEFTDRWLLKPVAKTYDWLTPDLVDDGVTNVFDNLGEIRNFANNLLQGKVESALGNAGRLVVNSTAGIGGFFDVASSMGLASSEEDFGQTLAVWNLGRGPYLVLPFLGPSTLRDSVSRIPDTYLLPQRYIDHELTRYSVFATDIVDTRADLLDAEDAISGDRYSFIRDVYLQRRAFVEADGQVEDDFTADDLEDY